MTSEERWGFRMVGPGALARFEAPPTGPRPGWAVIEVAGCGVCHTDLGYLYGGVRTAAPLPLVLGHEIAGRVVAVGAGVEQGPRPGAMVVVPAVSPCGECGACRRGRRTACARSQMPGNQHDGGFATHVEVPARWLCEVRELPAGLALWQLAALADAVSTAYQAMVRAAVAPGGVAVVVGAGGVGSFLIELLRWRGATVAALDVRPERLRRAEELGARVTVDLSRHEAKKVRGLLRESLNGGADGWHVFECSGSPAGQRLAFDLLARGGTLSVVGYSPETIELRFSNLMALDASAMGNWGCDPVLYPEVLALCLQGRVDIAAAVRSYPLSEAPAVLAAAHRGELDKRPVLVPHA